MNRKMTFDKKLADSRNELKEIKDYNVKSFYCVKHEKIKSNNNLNLNSNNNSLELEKQNSLNIIIVDEKSSFKMMKKMKEDYLIYHQIER